MLSNYSGSTWQKKKTSGLTWSLSSFDTEYKPKSGVLMLK